jgi:hypothetical protein
LPWARQASVDAMDEIVGLGVVNVKYLFYALSIFIEYGFE